MKKFLILCTAFLAFQSAQASDLIAGKCDAKCTEKQEVTEQSKFVADAAIPPAKNSEKSMNAPGNPSNAPNTGNVKIDEAKTGDVNTSDAKTSDTKTNNANTGNANTGNANESEKPADNKLRH